MKSKSLFLSLLGVGALLSSCANQGITGVYKFQLGNDKGTHMGLFMTLTDEDVIEPATSSAEAKTLGKKFTLVMDMKGMNGERETSSEASSDGSSTASSSPAMDDTKFEAYGYYVLGAKNRAGEEIPNRLMLGTTMLNDLFGITGEIPPELVENILYATLEDNKINIVIPVSMNDLLFQVYWYGIRLEITSSGFSLGASGCEGEIGSHPTKEDIKRIVETESAIDPLTNPYAEYRDYHTLTMGLVK